MKRNIKMDNQKLKQLEQPRMYFTYQLIMRYQQSKMKQIEFKLPCDIHNQQYTTIVLHLFLSPNS